MNYPPILLVEDDSNDALLLQRALRRAQIDYPVQVVTDGDQAICYLSGKAPFADRAQHPLPALVLLDLKLPRKPGLEVLAWIRNQRQEIKEIPVIVLTSSRHTVDIDQAYALGANSYMAKPEGNFDGLAEMVKHLPK
jgi:CheY-like chemotaxis protein